MNILAEIGQVTGSKLVNDSKNLADSLATVAELATFTGLPSATLAIYGNEGSAVKYQGETGKTYQINLKAKKPQSALYFDNNGVISIKLGAKGELSVQPNGVFGFVLMRKFDSSTYRSFEVEVQELNPVVTPQPFYTIGQASGNGLTQTYTLPNRGASLKKLSDSLTVDLTATAGLEGSAIVFSISNGTYSFELDASSAVESDELYAWNGNEIKKLWGFGTPVVTSADSVYGWLAFIAIDKVKNDGDQQFVIKNLVKVSEIAYQVPEIISLIPDTFQGAVKVTDDYLKISNGTSSIPCDANFPLTLPSEIVNPIEASFAEFNNIATGNYEIEYQIITTEANVANDIIYCYDSIGFHKLADRAVATIGNDPIDPTRWVSDVIKTTLSVTNKLGFITIDTENKSGTTEVRILGLKKF